jgi:diguanylate cyclase (GGDEF)-like protein
MLVIRSEALLPAAVNRPDASMNITLGLIGDSGTDSMLVSSQTAEGTRLERWLLPVFERVERISTSGQLIDIRYTQQQRLKDVLRPETVAFLILLFAAAFLSPWLLLRHYRALTRASIEHEQSAYLATHDVLTGVPNRYLLADRLKLAVHNWERNGARFAVILLDLDHFKEINDRFGHEAGDRVLCAAADRMTAQLRSCDTVARYGGDEFVILLTNVLDSRDAAQVGEKLLAAVSHPIATPGGNLTVSCSLGIAVCPDHGTDLDTLRRNADMAMYQAKQSGRRAVVVSTVQKG